MTVPWTDLVDPTREELLGAVAVRLDPDAIEMLTEPSPGARGARPLLETHGGYVLAVLSRPERTPAGAVGYLEVDVLAAPNALVTVRKSGADGELAPIDGVAARVEAGGRPGEIVQAIVDDVGDSFLELLDALYERIDALEVADASCGRAHGS